MQDFCRHCGRKLNGDEMRCPECGAPTDNMPADSSQYQRYERTAGKKPDWMPAVLMVVLIIAAAAVGLFLLSDSGQNTDSSDLSMKYEWDYKFDNGETKNYTYTLVVKRADYNAMMKSTIDRTGTTASEMYKTTGGTKVFGVKDYVVVDDYIKTLKGALEKYYNTTKPESAHDDLAAFISAFTQKAIAYDHDEEKKDSDYWRFPLETLCDKKGDCEDTAILNTALLYAKADDSSKTYSAGVFLLPGHAISAVKADEITSPVSDPVKKFDYYGIETAIDSGQYGIGNVEEKYCSAYFHLYTGYVTSYYQ